jgi:5,6-dimethylbenzimidazole synthase
MDDERQHAHGKIMADKTQEKGQRLVHTGKGEGTMDAADHVGKMIMTKGPGPWERESAGGDRGLSAPPVFPQRFRDELRHLLTWRRDVRHFRRDPLATGVLERLLSLVALSPSVGNAQPWRFVRVVDPVLRETLATHVDVASAAAANAYAPDRAAAYRSLKLHGLREAPDILAVFSDEAPVAGHALGIATMPEMLRYSTAMAIHTLWLTARAEGIGIGWVSILDPVIVHHLLDVPDSWTLMALLCIGYPEDENDTPELARRGWQARDTAHVETR